jgi:putative glutamine amidotransferase
MAPAAPLVGLTTYREPARWGVWDQSADLLPSSYARAVEVAGGVPVLLPPSLPYAASAAAVVARLDAVVVSGGADVEPALYDEAPHPATGPPRRDRDAWELALLAAADERGLPVLGVCRGMQVMSVAAGGALVQHLPDVTGAPTHDPGGDGFGSVEVRLEPGSLLADLLGAERTGVRCHHHQAVATHPGLTPVAWAEDGTVEALERPGPGFWLGVQWHPEVYGDAELFRALVDAASNSGAPGV